MIKQVRNRGNNMENKNFEVVKDLLKALSEGKAGEDLKYYYDPEAIQIEFPNLLSKTIFKRNLKDILEASLRGKQIISQQNFEVVKSFSDEDTVIIEVVWTGELSISLGKLEKGNKIKAYFAQFIEFKNGKIVMQRTYDCFENFI
jgi:ketosteroid isomerase-like protein